MTLQQQIKSLTYRAFANAFPEYVFEPHDIEIAHTKEMKLGHYQCNSALRLARQLAKKPAEIAEAVQNILATDGFFQEVKVAGPGFINFTIHPKVLQAEMKQMLQNARFGIQVEKLEKIVIDFSSPNVAKEMHVGHLRSTIIGDCIARVFEFLGHDVLRLNHIGDWGTSFGMLIAHIENVMPAVLTSEKSAALADLMRWYREAKKRFDENEQFKKIAQLKVVALQQNQADILEAWRIICAISESAYQEIYTMLNVKIITRGESFYNPYLQKIVLDLNAKGFVTDSLGAQCVFLPGFIGQDNEPLPLMIQKTDGAFNYTTTDLAAIWHRGQIEKADRILYVVDAGQSMHFNMVFALARKAGYVRESTRLIHIPFGLVLGEDGKKFKTRSGETEKLRDLLEASIQQAENILRTRGITAADVPEMAKILGINAVKYADLSCNRGQDYQFSYERMLKFEGNTAAFIMYSLVRVLSIQRKIEPLVQADFSSLSLDHPAEILLALHLVQFAETIEYIATELYPHRLTDYLYQLANLFNAFFRDCRVEGDSKQKSRSILLELTARVFKTGLDLLGLKFLEKM